MRGRASSTPKVPCETVTGSVTPRASQSVSASRSNVKAHAARAPCGQAAAVTLAGTRSRRGGTVPRDGEPEPEHAPAGLIGAERSPHRKIRRGPARQAHTPGSGWRAVLGGERLD